jgi:signal transduction histidine kinase
VSLLEITAERGSGAFDVHPSQRSVQRISLLLAAVAREASVSSVLSAIVEGLVETMGAASASVYLYDAQDRFLILSAHRTVDANRREQKGRMTLDDPAPAARAALAGTPLFTYEDAVPPGAAPVDPALSGRRAIHAAPLVAGDRRLGALSCEFAPGLTPEDNIILGDAAEVLGPLLERAMLLDSHGALQRYHELRQEWLAIVAHELRHPLHMLSMNALLVARRIGHEPLETRLQNIFHGVRQLDRMISDLQEVSAVEMRVMPLKKAPTDLAKLATEVVQRGCLACSRPVEIHADSGLPAVDVDALRIETVLMNVLINADKYAWVGTPLRLSIERGDGELTVSVTNEGEGIAPDEREAIFERFRRSRDVPSNAAGLGLGLYISRGLVEAHGGRMWVDSEPEQTTSFRFTLPFVAGESKEQARTSVCSPRG